MKSILCFGDFNTWGADPLSGGRFSIHDRWPGVLRDRLGSDYYVVEEGLGGRTTAWDDPTAEARNGSEYLLPCLWSHMPLDLVIIMLGTNDLKWHTATEIAGGVRKLVGMTLGSGAGPNNSSPGILLVCPPPLGRLTAAAESWGFGGAEEQSRLLAGHFRAVAEQNACAFLDAGEHIVSSDLDGVHLEVEEQHKLGEAIASAIKQIFEE